MKFMYHLYYWIFKYYRNEYDNLTSNLNTLINIGGLATMNLFAMALFIQRLSNTRFLNFLISHGDFTNRLIIIPLAISPIFLFFYFLYRKKKQNILLEFDKIEQMEGKEKKKFKNYVITYIVFSIIFLLTSITSPLWLKWPN